MLRERRGHREEPTSEGPRSDHSIELDQVSVRFGAVTVGERFARIDRFVNAVRVVMAIQMHTNLVNSAEPRDDVASFLQHHVHKIRRTSEGRCDEVPGYTAI